MILRHKRGDFSYFIRIKYIAAIRITIALEYVLVEMKFINSENSTYIIVKVKFPYMWMI